MKTIYKRFKGTITTGTNEVEVERELDAGQVLVAVLFADAPSKPAQIKVVDTGGSAIVEPSNYQDWQQRNGGTYLSSKKPMNFNGGQRVKVVATSEVNQTADWNFELLLVIQQN